MTSAVLLAAAALVTAGTTAAQTTPPAGNIDERVRQQLRPLSDRDREDALMTGDSDVILLRRTQLFSLSAGFDVTATSNAYLSPTNRRADDFAQGQISAGVGTRIGGAVDVFASVSATGVRYFRETSLDYDAVSGVVGARAALGPVSVTAAYQPSTVFERDFGKRQLTSHRFRLGAALPFRVKGVTVEPEAHGERAITHPGDYSAWSAGGSVTLSAPLSRRVPLLAYAQIGYDRRRFDDYFEAFIGTARRDDLLSAGAGVVWRPRAWAEARASYSFARNRSTSDVNGYRAHSGTIGLTGTLRF